MNVHPEPTAKDREDLDYAIRVPISELAVEYRPLWKLIRAIQDSVLAAGFRRAVVPEPEGDADYHDRAVRAEGQLREMTLRAERFRAALEAAAVVPVQTPPEARIAAAIAEWGRDDDLPRDLRMMRALSPREGNAGPPTTATPPASPVPSREAIARIINPSEDVWGDDTLLHPILQRVARNAALARADAVLALWGTPTEPTTEQEH